MFQIPNQVPKELKAEWLSVHHVSILPMKLFHQHRNQFRSSFLEESVYKEEEKNIMYIESVQAKNYDKFFFHYSTL